MKKILIIISLCLLVLSTFLLINKNEKIENNVDTPFEASLNYYSKDDFVAKENSITITLEENYNDCFTVTSNKDLEYIEIISIDENLEETSVLFKEEEIAKDQTLNFCYTLSETIPNIQIKLTELNGKVHTFTPIYNGINGTYDFSITI